MKTMVATRVLIWLLAAVVMMPTGLIAQDKGQTTDNEAKVIHSREELDRLLAPIALYPDAMLSQILMASTYPVEVVEADRWLRDHPNLEGESLNEALKDQPWDVSVKSLCHFPRVLYTMSEHLEETTSLGDAFISQQAQVMDTVQNLREKARAEGNLNSTDQQNVIVEEGEIVIEPEKPDVIYLPAYDPCRVYGTWWYPDCSTPWFWYPGISASAYIFGPPVFIGSWGVWSGFFWHRQHVYVDVHRTHYFHRVRDTHRHGRREIWRHDDRHRRGVSSRSGSVGQRFGRGSRPGVETRRNFRGSQSEMRQPRDRDFERRDIRPRIDEDRRQGRPGPEIRTVPERILQPRQQRVPTMPRPAIRTTPERAPQFRPERVPMMPRPEIRTAPESVPQLRPQRRSMDQPRGANIQRERPNTRGDAFQGTGRGPDVMQQSDRGWRSRSGTGLGAPARGFPGGQGGGRSPGGSRDR